MSQPTINQKTSEAILHAAERKQLARKGNRGNLEVLLYIRCGNFRVVVVLWAPVVSTCKTCYVFSKFLVVFHKFVLLWHWFMQKKTAQRPKTEFSNNNIKFLSQWNCCLVNSVAWCWNQLLHLLVKPNCSHSFVVISQLPSSFELLNFWCMLLVACKQLDACW